MNMEEHDKYKLDLLKSCPNTNRVNFHPISSQPLCWFRYFVQYGFTVCDYNGCLPPYI